LLDDSSPNLHWRVLVELIGRPLGSPAVERARGGANASGPVASLLRELHPDGEWSTDEERWSPDGGPGWRLVAAAQWGADPGDPRLRAACELELEMNPGVGGFATRDGEPESERLTARLVQALAELGFCRHLRFQEALAWLEETDEVWTSGDAALELPAAVLGALASCEGVRRDRLRERAVQAAVEGLVRQDVELEMLGHPNLGRSDLAELLWALARAGVAYRPELAGALERLQALQLDGGRWPRRSEVSDGLPLSPSVRPEAGRPSRWVTLRAVVAMNAYAVEAGIQRRFPEKPASRI
jgi:hypothetical protein